MHDVEEIFREDVTLFVAERCCFTFMEIQCYYYFFLIYCKSACVNVGVRVWGDDGKYMYVNNLHRQHGAL